MFDMLISSTMSQKKLGAFFDTLFHLETFSTNVTRLAWSMWLSMWKRHLGHFKKKKRESRNTWKRSIIFFFQVEDIEISNTFYKIQNFLGTWWSSIITTCLIKLLRTGPFVKFSAKFWSLSVEIRNNFKKSSS